MEAVDLLRGLYVVFQLFVIYRLYLIGKEHGEYD